VSGLLKKSVNHGLVWFYDGILGSWNPTISRGIVGEDP